jgi:phosphoribosylamine--glycine ligase
MLAEGTPNQGVLYIGIMLAEELGGDPIVIEYNARFGDPETEVIIPLLQGNGVDIYKMLQATASGNVHGLSMPTTLNGAAMAICLAAAGYPNAPTKGEVIRGLDESYRDVIIFHGGTKTDGTTVVTSGGRVLFVTGLGATLQAASDAANAAIGTSGVYFEGMQYRSDIGYRALAPPSIDTVTKFNNKN